LIIDSEKNSLGVDKEGLIYISYRYHHFIEVYTQNGILLRKWECKNFEALSVSDDQVFTISSGNKISQFTLEGKLIREWLSNVCPTAIVVEHDEIYLISSYHVHVFSVDGKQLRKWGTSGFNKGEFWHLYSITANEDRIYVVDKPWDKSRVQIFTRTGNYLFQFISDLKWFENICILQGTAYMTNCTKNIVCRYGLGNLITK